MYNLFMIQAKKNLGQNWLIDKNIINKIIDYANITNETNVIEIGPGQGALTELITMKAKKTIAIELDDKLCALIEKKYKDKNFKLICKDVLEINLDKLIKEEFNNEDVIVISNLPYYITSKIIFKNLESNKIKKQILMVQKEYGDRVIAKPGTKIFGRLSVGVQIFNDVEKVTDVSRNSFAPRPNVDSVVVSLIKKNTLLIKENESEKFLEMIKILFANKRKTIHNNLSNYLKNKPNSLKVLELSNIETSKRAEQLSIKYFIEIFNNINKL